ncbi:Enoyl-CoA hydratase/isomerase [Sphingobium chlorophenolicum L-1]|uniref:Enoyl-CoA hydratase/isomerase n=1 Tax=Sphingobium chlorophenolicum L-1 TaxID=690566 RepID=F6F345_SPHCR|nr:enoyl-CoA hydratase-related protein [Sphingobium chlorophenolicum]AEG50857.1 Enoyl-CoA hydratase/isomerase [Sphingobium chlorophenolicum L-1]
MTEGYHSISLTVEAGVASLTMRRPAALNSLSPDMMIELRDALEVVDGDPDTRVLLLSGEGRAFCAGADLSNAGPSADPTAPRDVGLVCEDYVNPLMRRLAAMKKPSIAAVNGAAAGIGCALAMHCDFVIAARSSYFMLAFARVGLIPDGGTTWLLPRLVGIMRATRMMMLGERIAAEQAAEWGLATQVCEDEDLAIQAAELARKLAAGPTKAYGLMRSAMRSGQSSDLDAAMGLERAFQREAGFTQDYAEGVRAFKEKRAANFTGA